MRQIIYIALGLALLGQVGLAGSETLERLDGTMLSGRVVSLTGEKLIFNEALEDNSTKKVSTIPLSEISQIDFTPAKDAFAESGQAVVETSAGDRLQADKLKLVDGKLAFECPVLGKGEIKISIDDIRQIILPGHEQTASDVILKIEKDKNYRAGSRDMLIIAGKEGKWKSPLGVLLRITGSKIFFRYRQADRTIDRKTVRAVILSEIVKPPKAPVGFLTTRQGSRLAFESLKIENKTILLKSLVFGSLRLDRSDVTGVRFLSDRVIELAGLKPSEVKEHGFFDTTFSYRTDRSVGGGPIRLLGRTYNTGLGLHSYSRLTYDLDKKFKTLVAVVGIDDAVRPGGNARLTILADGKNIFGPTVLTGLDKPIELRLDITGAASLTIVVDFGPDELGAGDHVDIANAKLIRAK